MSEQNKYAPWAARYVTLQRKKAILLKRLKSPPAVNQFNAAIDKNQAAQLLRLLRKYSPETKEAKKQRLLAMAKAQEGGGQVESKKPLMLKCFADSLAQPAVKPSADILCGDNARAQRCRQLQSQVRSRSYSQLLSCLARNVSKPVLATPNHTADLSELLLGCTEADFCK